MSEPARLRPAANPEAPLLHPRDVLDYFDEYKRLHEAAATGRALGPLLTSTPKLGAAIGGCFPTGVSILHGPPGAGKTALACQMAAEAGCPALIVSFEMPFLELLHRQAARITKTYVDKFRSRSLSPSVWLDHMRRTVDTMPQLRFLDGTISEITFPGVRKQAQATRGNSEHLLIVIDSAHSWIRRNRGSGAATEYDAIGQLLDSLQSLAHELPAAVLVIAEQNRASMGSDRQDAARGSGAFEYSGEVVIALSRENSPPDVAGEIPVTACLAKNRYGEQGSRFDLRFCGRRMSFREGDGTAIVSSRKNGKAG